jgi:hypothetical protein
VGSAQKKVNALSINICGHCPPYKNSTINFAYLLIIKLELKTDKIGRSGKKLCKIFGKAFKFSSEKRAAYEY